MEDAFCEFIARMPVGGTLIYCSPTKAGAARTAGRMAGETS